MPVSMCLDEVWFFEGELRFTWGLLVTKIANNNLGPCSSYDVGEAIV